VVDADTHTARILRDVVDAIRNGFAEFLVAEVMHVDLVGAAFRSIVAARVLVGADQFLLLGVEPRLIVLRAIPVARATALTPPYPAVRASAAANKRRSRS
jgi:hypothetical protein